MPRIPRCISSVFVWWIQAASMKHTSPCWPGRYGESSKPKKVPTRPKIMIQGPVGQIALKVAVWATYRKGMGKTSVKHNTRARSAPGKTSGSSKVWDKLLSLEHELRVEGFLGDTPQRILHWYFLISLMFLLYTFYLFFLGRAQSETCFQEHSLCWQQLHCPLFFSRRFGQVKVPKNQQTRETLQPLCISKDRTFDQPLLAQGCEIKTSLVRRLDNGNKK